MLARPANLFALAIAATSVVMASPLNRRDDPPTGDLNGLAQYSSFDGTSAWYVARLDEAICTAALLTSPTFPCSGTQLPADQPLVGIEGGLFDRITEACGRSITITANGVSQKATIQESCGDGCGENGLLLTTSLFEKFYPLDKGQFQATWRFD